ncbi:hypothetical protein RFI_23814, partial [Reticulomyxa filosa]
DLQSIRNSVVEKSKPETEKEKNCDWSLFNGDWTKLNSLYQIRIENGKIHYHDGSCFRAFMEEKHDTADATSPVKFVLNAHYKDGTFKGTLSNDGLSIVWNNSSTWIRNGYKKYVGDYLDKNDTQVRILADGTLEHVLDNGQKVSCPYMLMSVDEIGYIFQQKRFRGKICKNVGQWSFIIQWNGGHTWRFY